MRVAWILGLCFVCFALDKTETCTLPMKEEEADARAGFESNLKGRLSFSSHLCIAFHPYPDLMENLKREVRGMIGYYCQVLY